MTEFKPGDKVMPGGFATRYPQNDQWRWPGVVVGDYCTDSGVPIVQFIVQEKALRGRWYIKDWRCENVRHYKPRYRVIPAMWLRKGDRFVLPGMDSSYTARGFRLICTEQVICMVGGCKTLHIHGQRPVWVEVSRG